MDKTGLDVDEHVAQVTPALRRRDAQTLIDLMADITGRRPEMWTGSIVGFGTCTYAYPTGTSGTSPIVGFAARRSAATLYVLDEVAADDPLLARLGPHTRGASCLYLKDLEKNDVGALREIVQRAFDEVVSGGRGRAAFTVLD